MNNSIQYLLRSAIDTGKWDECIQNASNGLIYGNSWWLDNMGANWSALVLNDYEAVMPLTWKKKFGFRYLYQPWFTANLGVFYKNDLQIKVEHFIAAVPHQFKFLDIDLNENNTISKVNSPSIQLKERNNMLLNTAGGYEAIAASYSRLAVRKLRLFTESQLGIEKDFNLKEAIDFYVREYKSQHPAIKQKDYVNLIEACTVAAAKGNAYCYAAKAGTEIAAAYIVLKDNQYFYSLLGGSTKEGKELGAFYALTDAGIRDAATEKCTFRFEGSDIEGIAFFNSQFGAKAVTYQHIKLNKLPFPINLLKR